MHNGRLTHLTHQFFLYTSTHYDYYARHLENTVHYRGNPHRVIIPTIPKY